jgi:Flp pilus assembly protein TadG
MMQGSERRAAMRGTAKQRVERRDERGAALVEFALVLPILVFLLFGIIEFGRLLNTQVMITSAAREGARFATLGSSASAITSQVRASCPSLVADDVLVAVTNAAGASGTAVTVSVTYPVVLVSDMIASLFGSTTVSVTHTAVMRIE